MRNPFRYYRSADGLVVEDRDTGSQVASGVDRAYVHRIVDLLNRDAMERSLPQRVWRRHEVLRAYE